MHNSPFLLKKLHSFFLIVIIALAIMAEGCVFAADEGPEGPDESKPESPAGSAIIINDRADYTRSLSVTLTLSATDDNGVTSMLISNNNSFSDAEWEPYIETKEWTLTAGTGPKNVYILFRDDSLNESDTASASIIYIDENTSLLPDISINEGAGETRSNRITLTFEHEYSYLIQSMMVSNSPDFPQAVWEGYKTSKVWLLENSAGSKTVYVKFQTVNDEEITGQVSIELIDDAPPVNPSISINDGNDETQSNIVTLELYCEDGFGVAEMLIYSDGEVEDSSWEIYSTTKSFALTQGYDLKRIYAIFRDGSGNETDPVYDEILMSLPSEMSLQFDLAESEIQVGDAAEISITVTGARSLISARLTIEFNPDLIEISSIDFSGENQIFSKAGASLVIPEKIIDNTNGKVVLSVFGQKDSFSGANGDGIIASLTAIAKNKGDASFGFIQNDSEDSILYIMTESGDSFEEGSTQFYPAILTIE